MEAGASWALLGHARTALPILEKSRSEWLDHSQIRDYTLCERITWTPVGCRLKVVGRRSRKHAHTQRRLCERFAAPVIGAVTCQDIETAHTQAIVNAAPTAGEGNRVQGMISALVSAGLEGGFLANPGPQPGGRPCRGPVVGFLRGS